ncbi:MAG: hypothetical protein A2070_13720 [Bdellovibrionales bacterium GWC1_52_8]|nr:MAG: hypothetical protein A2X97_04960 [Bdellovibrionales bacterium GWA1_52_35]OFZ40823.1 MAG: hypothetical protein A2070_13720 [Bdellovibrionales bacterium GWC1_52_8]HCM38509.1 hypothetical protein [Bdellovibrionales bacterium]
MKWAFFGSSLVSAYWNGAATYYRGLLRAMAARGHEITFYEPDAYERQKNRDITDPEWAKVHVWPADRLGLERALESARDADLIVKASGVGVYDEELEARVLDFKKEGRRVVFWDVDAPATLDRMNLNPRDPFRSLIPQYDLIFTYGGGDPVVREYEELGASACVPVYNALDCSTHYRVAADSRFEGMLGFLGNRMPDREKRVDDFFFHAVRQMPNSDFLLGGNGWADKELPSNLKYLGHIYTHEHNAFNSSLRTVLNLNRESMVSYGYSPPTRVFEAAGAEACLITDRWKGVDYFFEPGKEVLVAGSGDELIAHLEALTPDRARRIGAAAYRKVIAKHTYDHRAALVDNLLRKT